MSKVIHHPKRAKNCVFCKFWIGDANMRYVNTVSGFEYDSSVKGRCTKRNGAGTSAAYRCSNYVPSVEAEKLL